MSFEDYNFTLVVIPTRNRADIAKNAVVSVLEQPGCEVRVLVSDNSTELDQVEELQQFCANHKDERLAYVRPPEPLSMPAHWEWAIKQAMSGYDASHFLYLTDRMMFKPKALQPVLDRVAAYPDKILSYNHDRIVDDREPIRIEQHEQTGDLFEVKTLRLSELYSQAIFHHAMPRMLNCVVPRTVLDRIQARFGNVFASIAPHFLFCCRCLELEDSILYYDKSPIFHYALKRSHGASVTRGEMTSSNADFTANLPIENTRRNYATPIPQLITAANAIYNEYLIFKAETGSPRFFDIDLQKYLRVNAEEISEVTDPRLQAELQALLVEHGLRAENNGTRPRRSALRLARKLLSPILVWNRLRPPLKAAVTAAATKPAWLFLARVGVAPPEENSFTFRNVDDAITYLKKYPRRSLSGGEQQKKLLQGRVLTFNSK